MGTVANPPIYTSLIQLDPATGKPLPGWLLSKDYTIWFQQSLIPPIQSSATILSPVSLTAQAASIGVTPIPLPSLASGTYRLTYYLRVTAIDAVSSSVQVTFGWTESTVTLSHNFAAVTGNTINTNDSQTYTVEIDQATALTYSTTYASNTPGAMKYRLIVVPEAL